MRRSRALGVGFLLLGCSGADGGGPGFLSADPDVVESERAPNDTDVPRNDSDSGGDMECRDADSECAAFCQRFAEARCFWEDCVANCVADPCWVTQIELGDCVIGSRCQQAPPDGDCSDESEAYRRCQDGETLSMPEPRSCQ